MPLIRHYSPGVVQASSGLVRPSPGGGFEVVVASGGTTTVSNDLADSYGISASVSNDLADSYSLRASVDSDIVDSYAVLTSVSNDIADSYIVLTSVSNDLADSYGVSASVSNDLADSYTLRAAVSNDLADSYDLTSSVSQDLVDQYAIKNYVSGDLLDQYGIIGPVYGDLVDSYQVGETQTSTGGGWWVPQIKQPEKKKVAKPAEKKPKPVREDLLETLRQVEKQSPVSVPKPAPAILTPTKVAAAVAGTHNSPNDDQVVRVLSTTVLRQEQDISALQSEVNELRAGMLRIQEYLMAQQDEADALLLINLTLGGV